LRKREGDGCPVAGALQLVGDKWTLLVVRDLAAGARRMTDILDGLYPISSRTLVDRLRDMESDGLLKRIDYNANPPHVEYSLTERGLSLLPLVDALRQVGLALGCNECEDRRQRLGTYCEACPLETNYRPRLTHSEPGVEPTQMPQRRREQDDSIVLL
jgi:DNA-binding HxlR family transcriptional regulator